MRVYAIRVMSERGTVGGVVGVDRGEERKKGDHGFVSDLRAFEQKVE